MLAVLKISVSDRVYLMLAVLNIISVSDRVQCSGSAESCCMYLQLAVLGACQCRGAGETDPCGCAYAATNLTREVYKLREEVGKTV